MHPELLKAANCHGSCMELSNLLSGGAVDDPSEVVVVQIDQSPASSLLLGGVTPDGDSALHIVAANGFLKKAGIIYDRAARLLDARNSGGNTPLHCAARAGHAAMAALLVELARGEEISGEDAGRAKSLVRMQNKLGETALHEAIRAGHMLTVDELMTADPCLARVPDKGTSPLFLAVSLRHEKIARELYKKDKDLSYSGPNGQNALHAAVLRSRDMTELILSWNKELTKKRDQHGNTPLHFAVSVETGTRGMLPQYAVPVVNGTSIISFLNMETPKDLTMQLLEADPHSAYQPDEEGSFPIHVAASAGRLSSVKILVVKCPGCASLRDTNERTFLHVAVMKRRYDIVRYACHTPLLSSILNKQDSEGNTALYLAVEVGDWWSFACLFANKQVDLNLPNNKQHTQREHSVRCTPTGLYCLLHSRILIQQALISADATLDIYQRDSMIKGPSAQSDTEIDAVISNSTQFLGLGLVLITTMAFGAAFALPGGYRADDHPKGGTPTLSTEKLFQGFLMANALAFICSSLAVLSLVFAGTPTVELPMRYMHYNISIWLSFNGVLSLGTAFVLAIYIMITPVIAGTAIMVMVVFSSLEILYMPSLVEKLVRFTIVVCGRLGILPVMLRSEMPKVTLLQFGPSW